MNTLTQSASGTSAIAADLEQQSGLIVVDEGQRDAPPADTRWCAALPAAARVLELGLGCVALARAYKQRHPHAHWTSVDLSGSGRAGLSPLGIDAWADGSGAGSFDLIVLTDVLPWLADPVATLHWLGTQVARGARLLLRVAHHASLSQLEELLDGDLGNEACRTAGVSQPRLLSHAVVYRQLMDAGWMPHLVDAHCEANAPSDPARRMALESLVTASGFSGPCAQHTLRFDRLVIEARRCFDLDAERPCASLSACFAVLVPTNNERQLRLNVEASPGLRESGARIVSVRGAVSAAAAFERGLRHICADWVLLCHQDVYFPAGFGHHLSALLAGIPPEARRQTLIGFVGLAAGVQGGGATPAGFVIDRLHRADHAESAQAISIDELAIVVARDTVHRIDPLLGWHLWATDLCVSAIVHHGVFPRIVRAPLFHNSRTGWSLPAAFVDSARTLAAKWPGVGALHTLCGTIDDAFLARHSTPG